MDVIDYSCSNSSSETSRIKICQYIVEMHNNWYYNHNKQTECVGYTVHSLSHHIVQEMAFRDLKDWHSDRKNN